MAILVRKIGKCKNLSTDLMFAAAVKLLLDMGSDINAQIETNRNTALTLACFQGRHEVVSLLLDRKANVEHRAKVDYLHNVFLPQPLMS
jgi:ankyrin repeat protein